MSRPCQECAELLAECDALKARVAEWEKEVARLISANEHWHVVVRQQELQLKAWADKEDGDDEREDPRTSTEELRWSRLE